MPRFLFVDFPLGNPCGKPWDVEMQYKIVGGALELLERAWLPRTTVQRPETWAQGAADERWRERFMWVGDDNRAALAQAGAIGVLSDERYAESLPLFGGVEDARFRRIVRPGDEMTLTVEIERLSRRGGWGRGVATVDGAPLRFDGMEPFDATGAEPEAPRGSGAPIATQRRKSSSPRESLPMTEVEL